MIKYLQIVIILFVFQQLNFAQTIDPVKTEKRNAVFIAPLNLFDFINPSLQIGYERFLKPQFSIQIEGAYIISQSIVSSIDKDFSEDDQSAKGYKVKVEIKYYWFRNIKVKPYVSCELFHTKNNLTQSHFRSDYAKSLTVSDPEYENYYAKYDINRTGVNIKFGVKFPFGKYLFIEPHIGLGIVYNDINKKGKLHDGVDFLSFDNVGTIYDKPNGIDVNVPFNVKLGCRF